MGLERISSSSHVTESAAAKASKRPFHFLAKLNQHASSSLSASMANPGAGREMTPLAPNYQPTPYDIVCGRGRGNYNASGNLLFRQIVGQYANRYVEAKTKAAKTTVLEEIVYQVKFQSNQKCKFIKKEGGLWHEIGDVFAREKAGHAMRECIATRKKQEAGISASSKQGMGGIFTPAAKRAGVTKEESCSSNLSARSLGLVSQESAVCSSARSNSNNSIMFAVRRRDSSQSREFLEDSDLSEHFTLPESPAQEQSTPPAIPKTFTLSSHGSPELEYQQQQQQQQQIQAAWGGRVSLMSRQLASSAVARDDFLLEEMLQEDGTMGASLNSLFSKRSSSRTNDSGFMSLNVSLRSSAKSSTTMSRVFRTSETSSHISGISNLSAWSRRTTGTSSGASQSQLSSSAATAQNNSPQVIFGRHVSLVPTTGTQKQRFSISTDDVSAMSAIGSCSSSGFYLMETEE